MDTLLGMHLFLSREGGSRPQTYHILGGKNNLEHHKSPLTFWWVEISVFHCFQFWFSRGGLWFWRRGVCSSILGENSETALKASCFFNPFAVYFFRERGTFFQFGDKQGVFINFGRFVSEMVPKALFPRILEFFRQKLAIFGYLYRYINSFAIF